MMHTGQRVAVFVDVQNMFYSAKLLHHSKLDYGKFLKEIVGPRQLVRAIAYIVQKKDVNQASFHEALERFGYDLKIKELKIQKSEDRTVARGSWDIGMAIDAITLASKIDVAVLVTGNGEFAILADALRSYGVRVELASFERSTAGDLIRACDEYIPIKEHLIFKEKKFEDEAAAATPDNDIIEEDRLPPDDIGNRKEKEEQPAVNGLGIFGKG
jgi:uncharacterized LabA/DUF88 family protein